VLVPKTETEQAAPLGLTREGLRAIGRVSLAVPIVAAVVQMYTSELLALEIGDAILLSPSSLKRPPCVGPVWLVGAHQEGGCRAEITADGRLVLRGTLNEADPDFPSEPNAANEESSMVASDKSRGEDDSSHEDDAEREDDRGRQADSLLAALGDAPVVVRVEIGVAQMPAREWAELGPGDVVALGRRIAEPVILRVGGREVARGELVDLEGEVGVRIMSRGEE
jgi:type III secretion system YscQ/HrcQ family protein